MINNVFLMDCGNIVEISMRTIDEVNAKRKFINGIVCGGCRTLETLVQVYIMF